MTELLTIFGTFSKGYINAKNNRYMATTYTKFLDEIKGKTGFFNIVPFNSEMWKIINFLEVSKEEAEELLH